MIVVHVLGLPVEETLPQLVSAGIAAFVALRLVREQVRRRVRRFRTHLRAPISYVGGRKLDAP